LKVNELFGEKGAFIFRIEKQIQQEISMKQTASKDGISFCFLLKSENGGNMSFRNADLFSSQKIELFTNTAERTSNPVHNLRVCAGDS
jgi:hypothetical protein